MSRKKPQLIYSSTVADVLIACHLDLLDKLNYKAPYGKAKCFFKISKRKGIFLHFIYFLNYFFFWPGAYKFWLCVVLEKLILPWKFSSLCLIFVKIQLELVSVYFWIKGSHLNLNLTGKYWKVQCHKYLQIVYMFGKDHKFWYDLWSGGSWSAVIFWYSCFIM